MVIGEGMIAAGMAGGMLATTGALTAGAVALERRGLRKGSIKRVRKAYAGRTEFLKAEHRKDNAARRKKGLAAVSWKDWLRKNKGRDMPSKRPARWKPGDPVSDASATATVKAHKETIKRHEARVPGKKYKKDYLDEWKRYYKR